MAKAKARRRAVAPQAKGNMAKPLSISLDTVKFTGHEPEWEGVEVTEESRKCQLIECFNWYNYHFGAKNVTSFLTAYMQAAPEDKFDSEMKLIKKVSDHVIPNGLAWLARMSLMGWELTEDETGTIDDAIREAVKNITVASPTDDANAAEVTKAKKFNIQERMRERAAEAGGEIEGMLDDYIAAGAKSKHDHSPVAVLKVANILPGHVAPEVAHFEEVRDEYKAAHAGKDKELAAGYAHLSKIQLRNIIKFLELIIADYHSYVAFKKVNKTPRKLKVKTPEQIAGKLKFMRNETDLSLVSENPAKIVGARELFAYDVKKRKLQYYVADEHAGNELSVKNSTIIGFDASKSVQKTIRKPDAQIKAFMAASRPNTRKLFDTNKSVGTKMSGRFNANIVILKVY